MEIHKALYSAYRLIMNALPDMCRYLENAQIPSITNVENNTITDVLKEYRVEKGDLFFLPAGRIHSIGAGCFIAEIQQTSNITYRTHYDREAKDENVEMIAGPYFTTSLLDLTRSKTMDYSALDSFVIYICVEGKAVVNGVEVNCGETILLPATTQRAEIETIGCKLLTTYIE